jgi:hypothetical protein
LPLGWLVLQRVALASFALRALARDAILRGLDARRAAGGLLLGAGLDPQRLEPACFALPPLPRDALFGDGAERLQEMCGRVDKRALELLIQPPACLRGGLARRVARGPN